MTREELLAPRPMTAEQVADLVERARANHDAIATCSLVAARAASARSRRSGRSPGRCLVTAVRYALLPLSSSWHVIQSVTPGASLVTRCRGRWHAEVERLERDDRPEDVCPACERSNTVPVPVVEVDERGDVVTDGWDAGGEG